MSERYSRRTFILLPLGLLAGCGSARNTPEITGVDLVDCNIKEGGSYIKPFGSVTVSAPNIDDPKIIDLGQVELGTDGTGNLTMKVYNSEIPVTTANFDEQVERINLQVDGSRMRFNEDGVYYEARLVTENGIPAINLLASCEELPGR